MAFMISPTNHILSLQGEWKVFLEAQFQESYMLDLFKFLESERIKNKEIVPSEKDIFNAFILSPFEQTKVMILGQDPYPKKGDAHGLAFSVEEKKIPASLRNIYKELKNDLGIEPPDHGNLTPWAKQGVLLLNSILTTEMGLSGSHKNKGWELFTDKIIDILNLKENMVFIFWGRYASNKASRIDSSKHLILESAHPSPLSARRGFFEKNHFSKCNNFLNQKGLASIDWNL